MLHFPRCFFNPTYVEITDSRTCRPWSSLNFPSGLGVALPVAELHILPAQTSQIIHTRLSLTAKCCQVLHTLLVLYASPPPCLIILHGWSSNGLDPRSRSQIEGRIFDPHLFKSPSEGDETLSLPSVMAQIIRWLRGTFRSWKSLSTGRSVAWAISLADPHSSLPDYKFKTGFWGARIQKIAAGAYWSRKIKDRSW